MYLFTISNWVTGPTTLDGVAVGAGEDEVEFNVVETDNTLGIVSSANARADRENISNITGDDCAPFSTLVLLLCSSTPRIADII